MKNLSLQLKIGVPNLLFYNGKIIKITYFEGSKAKYQDMIP